MKLCRIVLAIALVLLVCQAVGAEAAGEVVNTKVATTASTTVEAVSVVQGWVVSIIEVVAGLIGTYGLYWLTALIKLIFGQTWQTGANAEAITALQHGIQDAEEELVAELKNDTADGKLTAAEIARAKSLAYKRALEVASGSGLKLLEKWGADIAGNLISQLIQGKKTAAPTVVVNAAGIDSIQAPTSTTLEVTNSDTSAGATATAAITRAPKEIERPKPLTHEEIADAIVLLRHDIETLRSKA